MSYRIKKGIANITKTKKLDLEPGRRKKKEYYNSIYCIERKRERFVFCQLNPSKNIKWLFIRRQHIVLSIRWLYLNRSLITILFIIHIFFNIQTIRVLSNQNYVICTTIFLLYLLLYLPQFFFPLNNYHKSVSFCSQTLEYSWKNSVTRSHFANTVALFTMLDISSIDKACLVFFYYNKAL